MTMDVDTGVTLDRLLVAHAARGGLLPVAVAHSILVDLLELGAGAGTCESSLCPRDVAIDERGRAKAPRPMSARDLRPLFDDLLGLERDGLPGSARPLLAHLPDEEAELDTERLRRALAEHLTPPASHDEVADIVRALALPRPELVLDTDSEPPTLPPMPAGDAALEGPSRGPAGVRIPLVEEEPLSPLEWATLASGQKGREVSPNKAEKQVVQSGPRGSSIVAPSTDRGDEAGRSTEATDSRWSSTDLPEDAANPQLRERSASAERSVTQAAGALLTEITREGAARSDALRPVVRHEVPRSDPPVSVSRAPAARRSARARTEVGDSILGPSEDRNWVMWLAVLVALSGAMYLLFFR